MVAAPWSALIVFALLCVSIGLARFVRPRLPEAHRGHETVEAMQLMIGMLVTFTALVLGLLTASVKTAYDNAGQHLQEYALQLKELDQCMRNYGPATETARFILIDYTETLIASTWTSESPPAMTHRPDITGIARVGPNQTLGSELNQVYLALRHLEPVNSFQIGVRDDCLAIFGKVVATRRAAIEDDRSPISGPFFFILVFWLMVIFVSIGLAAPRNALSLVGIFLGAISLSLAIYVIVDLSHPYFIAFSSSDMRATLAAMTAPGS
jgi:hypothetical protein